MSSLCCLLQKIHQMMHTVRPVHLEWLTMLRSYHPTHFNGTVNYHIQERLARNGRIGFFGIWIVKLRFVRQY